MNRSEDLETRELRYFVAVAEELSFGRVARRLGMAQPPLSRAIRQLESRLGVQLLTRTTRQVALTAAGRVLLEQARPALDHVVAAGRRAQRAGQREPELVVAVKAGGDTGDLTAIVAAYAASGAYPRVRVVVGGWGEQTAMLRDGRADVALLRTPFDQQGLDVEPLLTEPRVAVLPAAHRLANRQRLHLADLADEPTSRWPGTDAAADAYWSGRDTGSSGDWPRPQPVAGGEAADRPEVNDIAQLFQVVALGQAVAYLPVSAVEHYAPDGVIARPVTGLSPSVITAVWPETSRSLAVAAFVRAAAAVTAEPSGPLTARVAHADLLVPPGPPRRQRPDPEAVAQARRAAGRGTSLASLVGDAESRGRDQDR